MDAQHMDGESTRSDKAEQLVPSNLEMEPTLLTAFAALSLRSAAHFER